MRHSRPDVANAAREWSKVILIEYVFNIKNLGLVIESTGDKDKPCEIEYFSDNYDAGDTDKA